MIISVVPNLMPFVDNATHKARITLRICAHNEKGGFHVCRFQDA